MVIAAVSSYRPYCCIDRACAIEMASASEVWSQLFSWIALVLTVALMLPQAWLNYQKQSTQGLSTAMLLSFLIASIIPSAYYVYQSEPVALTLSWFGFAIVGIFVLCQVPYYAPTSDIDAAGGSERQQLMRRRRQFVCHFAAYVLTCGLSCVFFYFVFIVTGPSASFSWLPSALGYLFPTVLTVCGYLLQLRLIVATKDSSGISPGFMALDVLACSCSVVSIALDQWDGAAVAPFFVIISCQCVLAMLRFCIYPPHKQYTRERQDEPAETSGREDEEYEEEEEEEQVEDDEEGGEEVEQFGRKMEEAAEEKMESGMDEHSGAGHVQLDTSLDSTDDEEDEHGGHIEMSVIGVDDDGYRAEERKVREDVVISSL